MSPVISVENLSKKYIIGHQKQARYTTLRDVLTNGAKQFTNKLRHPFAAQENDPTHEEFWALKDVSFDIQQGDRVGIIGRNGAGKSTLLKILSRITEPTSGRVSIKGRVASLLEVGTGFHPELTGRENIFLNGAILGMSKADIKSKFDEIVAFAEVERFLDTPVKRYSSGMYVRLAFAVAAHLEPEVLIVDEVLAVGDAQFQKKCLSKMGEVSKEGRTILFVSHNMDAIYSLCSSAIMLEHGMVAKTGTSFEVTEYYLGRGEKTHNELSWSKPKSYKSEFDDYIEILGYSVLSDSGEYNAILLKSRRYSVEIDIEIKKKNENIVLFVSYFSNTGELLFVSDCYDSPNNYEELGTGRIKISVPIPVELFNTGRYYIELSCVIHRVGWPLMNGLGQKMAFEFVADLPPTKMQFTSTHPFTGSLKPGLFNIKLPWTILYKNPH